MIFFHRYIWEKKKSLTMFKLILKAKTANQQVLVHILYLISQQKKKQTNNSSLTLIKHATFFPI